MRGDDRHWERVAELERLFRRWDTASTSKRRAAAMHQAIYLDANVIMLWAPGWLRRSGCSRQQFSRGVSVFQLVRERGEARGDPLDCLLELAGRWTPPAGKLPTPDRGLRRCEGRSRSASRAHGGSSTGTGGSGRGGDRGDDSGGAGGDSGESGGEGEGSRKHRRWFRRLWSSSAANLAAVVIAAVTVASAFGLTPVAQAPQKTEVIREKVIEPVPVPPSAPAPSSPRLRPSWGKSCRLRRHRVGGRTQRRRSIRRGRRGGGRGGVDGAADG